VSGSKAIDQKEKKKGSTIQKPELNTRLDDFYNALSIERAYASVLIRICHIVKNSQTIIPKNI